MNVVEVDVQLLNENIDFKEFGENKGKEEEITKLNLISKILNKISLIFFIICMFIIFLIIGSNAALSLSLFQDRGYYQPSELEFTAEFQINLYPHDWAIRNEMFKEFFDYFEMISGFQFSATSPEENYRNQIHYVHMSQCHPGKWDIEFRYRNIFMGPDVNSSTLDAKLGTIPYEEGLIAPLYPADDLLAHSDQKLELDVHPCEKKYSRESRVSKLPSYPVLKTCGDFHRYYPHIWSNETADIEVPQGQLQYWYSGVYRGTFENGATFKADVTLKYSHTDDLLNGDKKAKNLPTIGEFSLRVWAPQGGHAPWNKTVFDEITWWHELLLKKFGSNGDYPCSHFL